MTSSFCWNRRNVFFLFFAVLSCLSVLDIFVLEYVIKPVHKAYHIPWKEFMAPLSLGGKEIPLMKWHYVFIPTSIFLFGLLGVVSRSWKVFLGGNILMFTGCEDTLYYVFQWERIPAELPWLDPNPYLFYLSRLFGGNHVNAEGLILGNLLALLFVFFFLRNLKIQSSSKRYDK